MNGKRAVLGVAAVCAVALSANAAIGAGVAFAENNTAFTCAAVKAEEAEFADTDCTTGLGGEKLYGHVKINEGEETGLTLAATSAVTVTTTIAGGEVVVTAKSAECVGCMIHNHAGPLGAMDVTGTGRIRFDEVTTNAPTCTVTGGSWETEALEFTTPTANELTMKPIAGTTWAVIRFNAGCIWGANITLTGTAGADTKGALLDIDSVLGFKKVNAFLEGDLTMSGGITGLAQTPLALTPS